MGSPETEKHRYQDEGPRRLVVLTKGFWLGVTPVTQVQWQAVMGNNPSRFQGANRPVEQVSWHDCQEFCKRLEELMGCKFSLPTEAQFEFACRAGTTTPYNTGETLSKEQAQFSASETCDVGTFRPNAFGLHDMHGNVWEWCQDWYGPYQSKEEEVSEEVLNRIARGGSWILRDSKHHRSANRGRPKEDEAHDNIGLRLVVDPDGIISEHGKTKRGGCYANSGICMRSTERSRLHQCGVMSGTGARVTVDPVASTGYRHERRLTRGGSAGPDMPPVICRSSYRNRIDPLWAIPYYGVRLSLQGAGNA